MANKIGSVRCGVGCGHTLVLVYEEGRYMLHCPPSDNPGGHRTVYLNPGDELPADFVAQMQAACRDCERRSDHKLVCARTDHPSMQEVHKRHAEVWDATAALYRASETLYAQFSALPPHATEPAAQSASTAVA